jgi:hypothetical protein
MIFSFAASELRKSASLVKFLNNDQDAYRAVGPLLAFCLKNAANILCARLSYVEAWSAEIDFTARCI